MNKKIRDFMWGFCLVIFSASALTIVADVIISAICSSMLSSDFSDCVYNIACSNPTVIAGSIPLAICFGIYASMSPENSRRKIVSVAIAICIIVFTTIASIGITATIPMENIISGTVSLRIDALAGIIIGIIPAIIITYYALNKSY